MVMGRENKRKKAQCVMRDVSMALSHSLEGQAFRSVMSFEAEWTQIVHFRLCETPRGRMEDLGKSKYLLTPYPTTPVTEIRLPLARFSDSSSFAFASLWGLIMAAMWIWAGNHTIHFFRTISTWMNQFRSKSPRMLIRA